MLLNKTVQANACRQGALAGIACTLVLDEIQTTSPDATFQLALGFLRRRDTTAENDPALRLLVESRVLPAEARNQLAQSRAAVRVTRSTRVPRFSWVAAMSR